MPRLASPLAAFLLAGPVLVAQAPVIHFEKTHHDFGKVSPDHRQSTRYRLTNKGDAPLQIHRLNPSCGCSSTVLGQWYLKPGESTEVEVTFDPKGMRGLVRKSLQVVSSDPRNPSLTLTFEAEVVQEVNPVPGAVFFHDVPRATFQKASVRLEPGTNQPVVVREVRVPGVPYLAATFRNEGSRAVVELLFDGRKVPAGRRDGVEKVVVVTASRTTPLLPLDVSWSLKTAILTQPVRVAWMEDAGRELRAKVVLTHAAGRPFRVLSAKPSHASLWVDGLGRAASPRQELQVVLAASARAGRYTESILLATDDPDQPQVELRVSAVLR